MVQNKNNTSYHIWNSDEVLLAKANADVQLPDGSHLYTNVGKIAIKKGDAIYVDYGRSMGVYTRSGRGYEAEYKFGKVTLHGTPVHVILTQEQAKGIKFVETSKEEFEAKVAAQKARIAPKIEELKDVFIFSETKRRAEARAIQAAAEIKRKEQIRNTVAQMGQMLAEKANPNKTSNVVPLKPKRT